MGYAFVDMLTAFEIHNELLYSCICETYIK